jgi:hypothetical protein
VMNWKVWMVGLVVFNGEEEEQRYGDGI